MSLTDKHCAPCEGGTEPLSPSEASSLAKQVPQWNIVGQTIQREWLMPDFVSMMGFVEAIGSLAENEGHHPDIHMTNYRMLQVVLTTHAIGGLSDNDFILAAKIDALPENPE